LLRIFYRLDHGNSFLENRMFGIIQWVLQDNSGIWRRIYSKYALTSLVTTSHSPSLARIRNSSEPSTTSSCK
jgi:hypothetical protein